MSVQATTWVWEQGRWTGNYLLVMLAVADAANREGEQSYQSVATLSKMTGAGRSTVYRILGELEREGALVRAGRSKFGTVVWSVPIGLTVPEILEEDRINPSEGGSQSGTEGGSQSGTGPAGETEGVPLVGPDPKVLTPVPVEHSLESKTDRGDLPASQITEAPEVHPSRAVSADWQPRVPWARHLMSKYPGIDVRESARRFVLHHVAKQDTSRSWEAALEVWVSHDWERWTAQQGTDDLGVPKGQRRRKETPLKPGDEGYFDLDSHIPGAVQ